MKGKPEQKNKKTHWAQRVKDAMEGWRAEKQEERKDQIMESTESSLRHSVQEIKQFKRASGHRVKNNMNKVSSGFKEQNFNLELSPRDSKNGLRHLGTGVTGVYQMAVDWTH